MIPTPDVHPKADAVDGSLHPVVRDRWSPRAFAEETVAPAVLRRVLEAARWASSSFNEQPWHYLVARRGEAGYETMLDGLNDKNRAWASSAPVLMFSLAKRRYARNDRPNRHAWHDVGLATGNLLAQATAEGLYGHQMAGIDPDFVRERLGIPDAYDVVAGIALGYLAAEDVMSEDERAWRAKPRSRRPLRETVSGSTWGGAPEWLRSP